MVAVTTDYLTCVLVNTFSKLRHFLIPELPAWCRHDDKYSEFVTRIHERWILWIVCRTDNIEASILQTLHITTLLRVRQSIAHIRKVLMAVSTHKLAVALAIEPESVLALELERANADACRTAVDNTLHCLAILLNLTDNLCCHGVEIRRLWRP